MTIPEKQAALKAEAAQLETEYRQLQSRIAQIEQRAAEILGALKVLDELGGAPPSAT